MKKVVFFKNIDRFELIRWSIILFLALLISHFFAYEKLPFIFKDYTFPWRTFGLALIFGTTICHANTTINKYLKKKHPLNKNLKNRIIRQFLFIWIVTIIIFTILYIGINGLILKKDLTFISYSFFLFISLFISTFEGLILILLEMYKQSMLSEYKNEDNVEKVVNNDKKYITVKTADSISNIEVNNIAYVNSKNGIVILKDFQEKKFISQYTSLNEIIDLFDSNIFYRVNRQFLLNRHCIKKLEDATNKKLDVHLKEGFLKSNPVLSCSRYKSKELRDWFNNPNTENNIIANTTKSL
ncbi:LytTR family DNA-binding domain-containing protein [uncultured Psychroserpens sp.]|uniref:LytR/AlgR family response regulator transcription factor n=1 Tax=uncultured Psychroserpens sp. TaxID=255436 RepID=UPI0026144A06|nr:LytTR family DNA-binding domain-containing protein [uncultured Psychroserpens sp.]